MQNNSKIYIAGHTGMVGSSLVRRLKKDGYSNILLRTRKELDLFDQQAVDEFFLAEQPEYVVVAAARVGGIKENMLHQADFLFENLTIQNNIIWSAHKHSTKKLLFLGSSCIYPRESKQPMREDYFMTGPLEPTNEGYAIAKIAGMKLSEMIYEQYNKEFVSCMPTNIFGIYDNFDPDASHVIPALIRRMHQAKLDKIESVVIWGSGESRREFLYVDDLADALLFLLKNFSDKQFINVGTGEDISIKELAFAIKDVVAYEGELVFDSTKPDGMPRKRLDVSRLTQIGWKPTTTLQQGLKTTYSWYLKNIS